MNTLFTVYTPQEIKTLIKLVDTPKSKTFEKLLSVKKYIKIFNEIDDFDLRRIIKDLEFKRFQKGKIVIEEGAVSDEIYYILSGSCNVIANRKIVGKILTSHVFGEIASLAKVPRTATVRAFEETTALAFKINYDLIKDYPLAFAILYRNFTKELIDKLVK